jgi:uridine kinase
MWPFEVSVGRCARRDGTSPDPEAAAKPQVCRGTDALSADMRPAVRATLAIDNNDLSSPFILHSKG